MPGCADLNADGIVNFGDLAEFKAQFSEFASQLPGCRVSREIRFDWSGEDISGEFESSFPVTFVIQYQGDECCVCSQ